LHDHHIVILHSTNNYLIKNWIFFKICYQINVGSYIKCHWCRSQLPSLLPPSSGCPDDGGSKHPWNVSKFLPDYTEQHPRRLSSSYLPPWEPEISLLGVDKDAMMMEATSTPEMSVNYQTTWNNIPEDSQLLQVGVLPFWTFVLSVITI
jgi:hypothetical protein